MFIILNNNYVNLPMQPQYFSNFQTGIFFAASGNQHKSERSIWIAGALSCLYPKGRRRPAVRIAI
jgi:hypothetical protein